MKRVAQAELGSHLEKILENEAKSCASTDASTCFFTECFGISRDHISKLLGHFVEDVHDHCPLSIRITRFLATYDTHT